MFCDGRRQTCDADSLSYEQPHAGRDRESDKIFIISEWILEDVPSGTTRRGGKRRETKPMDTNTHMYVKRTTGQSPELVEGRGK